MKCVRLFILTTIALSGCAPVGPDYRRMDVETPSHFKESSVWKFARPADHLPRGSWWTVFGDSTLNRLESQAATENPGLRAALLRVEQARLVARGSSAGLLPSAAISPSAKAWGSPSPNPPPRYPPSFRWSPWSRNTLAHAGDRPDRGKPAAG